MFFFLSFSSLTLSSTISVSALRKLEHPRGIITNPTQLINLLLETNKNKQKNTQLYYHHRYLLLLLTNTTRHTHRCLSAVYTEYFRCNFIHPFNMGSRYGRSYLWVFNCIMLLLRGMFTIFFPHIYLIALLAPDTNSYARFDSHVSYLLKVTPSVHP